MKIGDIEEYDYELTHIYKEGYREPRLAWIRAPVGNPKIPTREQLDKMKKGDT